MATLRELIRDGMAIAGASSIAYGAWLVYQPAGFIVAGMLTLAALYLQVSGSRQSNTGG